MPKPKIIGGLPVDRHMMRRCRIYLQIPEAESFPEDFASELAQWVLDHIPSIRFSPPEMAAMVDDKAVRVSTIAYAIELVAEFLDYQYSVAAIAKAHNRYGKTARAIAKERKEYQAGFDDLANDLNNLTPEERKKWEQFAANIEIKSEALKSASAAYLKAKNLLC